MMRTSFHRDFLRMVEEKGLTPEDLPGPIDIVITYYAAGITSAILYWVAQDMPYTIDEMVSSLSGLLLQPIGHVHWDEQSPPLG